MPDSHEDRLARVRHVVQEEASFGWQDEIPSSLRRQQWSALNVPLMWAASEGDRDCGVFRWWRSRADTLPPLSVGGEDVSAHDAAVAGWEVLHNTMQFGH